jgi:hypothetical protein
VICSPEEVMYGELGIDETELPKLREQRIV